MEELVGKCSSCGKEVYCENGFLAGIYADGKLLCPTCAKRN
ncbi:hypothetical protein [Ornithinibacillus contaminans]|nr:hypothetical protein [Ornithinibacillus contaminans]